MSYRWATDEWHKRREHAVKDVLDGMPIIGATVVWDVQADALQRWVDEASANGQNAS